MALRKSKKIRAERFAAGRTEEKIKDKMKKT